MPTKSGHENRRKAEHVSILRRADIFYDLTEAQIEMIAALCTEITPREGELVIEESGIGTDMYVIASGVVEILIGRWASGLEDSSPPSEVALAKLSRGQTFGEIALVDQGLRSASVRCVSKNCRLLAIPRDRLLDLCDAHPDLGYRLMRNIAADLAYKVRNADFAIRNRK